MVVGLVVGGTVGLAVGWVVGLAVGLTVGDSVRLVSAQHRMLYDPSVSSVQI